jgi:hypothetical protein
MFCPSDYPPFTDYYSGSPPIRVDLFIWDETPERFRQNIEQEHVALIGKDDSELKPLA